MQSHFGERRAGAIAFNTLDCGFETRVPNRKWISVFVCR
jgi:hypothetical protein